MFLFPLNSAFADQWIVQVLDLADRPVKGVQVGVARSLVMSEITSPKGFAILRTKNECQVGKKVRLTLYSHDHKWILVFGADQNVPSHEANQIDFPVVADEPKHWLKIQSELHSKRTAIFISKYHFSGHQEIDVQLAKQLVSRSNHVPVRIVSAIVASNSNSQFQLGLADFSCGRYAEAAEHFSLEEQHQNNREPLTSYFLGRSLSASGQPVAAISSLQSAHVSRPNDTDVWQDYVKALVDTGRFSEARQETARLLSILELRHDTASIISTLRLLARLQGESGDLREQLETLSKAKYLIANIKRDHSLLYATIIADTASAYYDIVLRGGKRQLVKDAILMYDEALSIIEHTVHGESADLATIESNLGLLYLLAGDEKRATEYLTKSVKWQERNLKVGDPARIRSVVNLSKVYIATANYEKALGLLQPLTTRIGTSNSQSSFVDFQIGSAKFYQGSRAAKDGKPLEAQRFYREAFEEKRKALDEYTRYYGVTGPLWDVMEADWLVSGLTSHQSEKVKAYLTSRIAKLSRNKPSGEFVYLETLLGKANWALDQNSEAEVAYEEAIAESDRLSASNLFYAGIDNVRDLAYSDYLRVLRDIDPSKVTMVEKRYQQGLKLLP